MSKNLFDSFFDLYHEPTNKTKANQNLSTVRCAFLYGVVLGVAFVCTARLFMYLAFAI